MDKRLHLIMSNIEKLNLKLLNQAQLDFCYEILTKAWAGKAVSRASFNKLHMLANPSNSKGEMLSDKGQAGKIPSKKSLERDDSQDRFFHPERYVDESPTNKQSKIKKTNHRQAKSTHKLMSDAELDDLLKLLNGDSNG